MSSAKFSDRAVNTPTLAKGRLAKPTWAVETVTGVWFLAIAADLAATATQYGP